MFLAKTLTTATILTLKFSGIISYDLSAFPLMGLEVTFMIYLIIKRPYDSGLMNLGGFFCQFSAVYAFGLSLLNTYFTFFFTEETDVLLVFVLQGLLLLSVIFTFIRIIKSYCNSWRKCFREKDEKCQENLADNYKISSVKKGQKQAK